MKKRVMAKMWAFMLVVMFSTSSPLTAGECKIHIQLHSAKFLALAYGKSPKWVSENVKFDLWEKPEDKGRVVGKILPGSRALILESTTEDFKVKSPLDGSIGWINKIHVSILLKIDTETGKECE